MRTRVFPYAIAIAVVTLIVVALWSVFRVFLAPDDAVIIQVVPIDDEDDLQVQVEGAVHAPGVYSLAVGSSVSDAVARAGGFINGASLPAVEASAQLTDGHFVYVPSASTGSDVSESPVDINSADTSELETLPGIGPVIAGRIVAYRDGSGGFTDVGELAEVAGVSERMVEELDGLIVANQQ